MYFKYIKIAWISFASIVSFALLWFVLVGADFLGLFGGMPELTKLENPESEIASELYSADGVLLGKYFRENRSPIEHDKISPNLLKALYATEDIRFDAHSGIDAKGTFAVIPSLLMGKRRGSSTITQQLAKNLFKTRTAEELEGALSGVPVISLLVSKTKEWILAVQLERSYTKKEIVTMYLNTSEFSQNAYGIQVAAKTYFNTSADSVNLLQASLLIGMLQNPTSFNPVRRPDRATLRRNTVIEQMEKYDFISSEEAETMKSSPLNLNLGDAGDHNAGLAPYFRSYSAKFLQAWCKKNGHDLYSDGLKIYTTIDSRMQRYAEAAIDTHIRKLQKEFIVHWKGRNPWIDENGKEIKNFLEIAQKKTERYRELKRMFGDDSLRIQKIMNTPVKMKVFTWDKPKLEKDTTLSPVDSIRYYKHFLQTGMMAMEVKTGHIKAWVGGTNHKYFQYDHVKQGARQPGSTFKPIVYATSIEEQGYSPCERVTDIPRTFVLATGGTWTAKNSSGGYSGASFTLRQALAASINTVAAYLMEKLKDPQIVISYAQRLGITTPLDAVPALCLGSSDVSVYDLVGAYSTFANKGTWVEPNFITKITDKSGKNIFQKIPQKKEVLSEQTAYIMTHLMRGSNEDGGGTAWELRRYNFKKDNEIASKTGTTSNYSDGWFMGMSKDLSVGVWTGGDDRSIHFRTIGLGAGAHMSLPPFAKFLEQVYADQALMKQLNYGKGKFPKPEQLRVELDCTKYGFPTRGDSTEYFIPTGNPLRNDF